MSNEIKNLKGAVVKEINGVKYFILRVNGGLTLVSKCGTNNIPIRLDSDFGTF